MLLRVGERLDWRACGQVDALPADSHWQALAKDALGDDLASLQRPITARALGAGGAGMLAGRPTRRARTRAAAAGELADSEGADLAMLSVALRELRNVA